MFFTDGVGAKRFCAVETKYTEPFSVREYDEVKRPRYADITHGAGSWFKPDSLGVLKKSKTNQLWRNVMLASALEQLGNPECGPMDSGEVMVLCLEDDVAAKKCVADVRERLVDPTRLHHVTLERFVNEARGLPQLRTWAERFALRYLRADDLADREPDLLGPRFGSTLTSPFA